MDESTNAKEMINNYSMNDSSLNLGKGIQKIGEIFNNEIKLIRTILISFLTVLVICILLYFNYILIGQFFTTIFLSFISSLAVKPLKDLIVNNIENQLITKDFFSLKSFVFLFLKIFFKIIRKVILTSAEKIYCEYKKYDKKDKLPEENQYLSEMEMIIMKEIREKDVNNAKMIDVNQNNLSQLPPKFEFIEFSVMDHREDQYQKNERDNHDEKIADKDRNNDNLKKKEWKFVNNNPQNRVSKSNTNSYETNKDAIEPDNLNTQKSTSYIELDNKNIDRNNGLNYNMNFFSSHKDKIQLYLREGSNKLNSNTPNLTIIKDCNNINHKKPMNGIYEDKQLNHENTINYVNNSDKAKIAFVKAKNGDCRNLELNKNAEVSSHIDSHDGMTNDKINLVKIKQILFFDGNDKQTLDGHDNQVLINNEAIIDSNYNSKKSSDKDELESEVNQSRNSELFMTEENNNKTGDKLLHHSRANRFHRYSSFDFSENLTILSERLSSVNYSTIFNNYKYLIFVCSTYIIIFKLTVYFSLTLILILLFLDFLFRLLLDLMISFMKFSYNNFMRSFLFEKENDIGEVSNGINPTEIISNTLSRKEIGNNGNNCNVKPDNINGNKIQNLEYLEAEMNMQNIKKEQNREKNIFSTKEDLVTRNNVKKSILTYPKNGDELLQRKNVKTKSVKFSILARKKFELNENAHSIISIFILSIFSISILIILSVILILFYFDMKKIYFMLSENNEHFVQYIKTMIPNNISEFYNQNMQNGNNFPENKILLGIKSIEAIFNSSFEANGTDFTMTNFTIYDITNKIYSFVVNPYKINENIPLNLNLNNIQMEDFYSIINNSKYYSDLANSTNVEILDYYGGSEDENIGYCKKFENETIYTILSSISDYGLKIFCRIRTLSDYITQYISFSQLNKYLLKSYKFLKKTLQFILSSIVFNFFSLGLELINWFMLLILFLSCLNYFISMRGDFVTDVLKILPYTNKQIEIVNNSFRNSIQGVFITTVEIFIFHSLITWLLFDIFNIDFVYIFSLLAGIISLIPIVSPWIILIPANAVYFGLNELSFIKMLILDFSYCFLISTIDTDIYKKNVKISHPYVTGLSFVMGVYTFGFKGLVYGPVLLCVSITTMDIIRILIE